MNIKSVVSYVKANKKPLALKVAKFAGVAATVIVADAVARKLATPEVEIVVEGDLDQSTTIVEEV